MELEKAEFGLRFRVRKKRGYKWPGVIIGICWTLEGKCRYVVECTVPEVAGALHIYSAKDLELDTD